MHEAIESSDLATPDGMSVVWQMRRLGIVAQKRVDGPDLMWKYCQHAESSGQAVFLYGSAPETLEALQAKCYEL